MTQSVEAPLSSGTDLDAPRTPTSSTEKERSYGTTSAILFNELVLARFRWFTLNARFGELGGAPSWLAPAGSAPDPPITDADRNAAERTYREALDRFTELEGEIVAAYWSVTVPSGVVMTMRSRRWPLGLFLDSRISLHRATTWLTGSDSRVAELLHHCDTLGNKAAEILRRTPKRVAMTWIFSTESYLLDAVEERTLCATPAATQTNGRPETETTVDPGATARGNREARVDRGAPPADAAGPSAASSDEDELVTRGRSEVLEIEKYYDRAAANAARFIYFWGMLVGAVLAAAVGALGAVLVHAVFDVLDPDEAATRFFFGCYAAGALGAIVSVLSRMRSERFSLDYEVGRMPAFWLGTFRPFLGAVFGLVVYFALESEVVQLPPPPDGGEFFFFTLFAFVAGFSERLTKILLGSAERTVAGTLEEADKAVGAAANTRASSANERPV